MEFKIDLRKDKIRKRRSWAVRWNDQSRSRYQFDATTVTVAWFIWVERWTIKLERKCAEAKLSQNINIQWQTKLKGYLLIQNWMKNKRHHISVWLLVFDFWLLAFQMTYLVLILQCILKYKFKFSADLRSHIPESCATSSIWNIRIGGTGTCTPQCLHQCLYWNIFSFYISQSSIDILFFWIHFIDFLK